ncbi:MAG TPA: hypothetical protein VEZ70_03370 [Allosphingosinicella sp.]|nr:hypothetical protein [Allosphingosinicella sp.]
MQNRVPAAREERAPLPEFAPVPRRYRHDGWTPERQKAFIEALADTGSVRRAARQVNMSQANAYALRRSAGAEGFRRAWDAALDFGLKRLKDIAFERAVEGYLVPVFVAGKLMGFRRKHNDALLMFCLRHYGRDAGGKRTTVNYFSSRASAGAGAGGADGAVGAEAEASATTVRTVISGGPDGAEAALSNEAAAEALAGFEGAALDPQAAAEIAAALEACAARAREARAGYAEGGLGAALAARDDLDEPWVPQPERASMWDVGLEPPVMLEDGVTLSGGEDSWEMAGEEMPEAWARYLDAAEREAGAAAADGEGEASGD